MVEAVRKDPRWKFVIAHARAIHGALGECLKLSDQLSDVQLKRETMFFVNAMERIAATFLGPRRRIGSQRTPDKELVKKLQEEVGHIFQLLEATERVADELGDGDAKKFVFHSFNSVNKFTRAIEQNRS